jgi:hypothetical protein
LPIPEPIKLNRKRKRKRKEAKMSKTFSVADVAAHKDAESGMYIIVDENVYDVTGTLFLLPPPPHSPTLSPATSPSHTISLSRKSAQVDKEEQAS